MVGFLNYLPREFNCEQDLLQKNWESLIFIESMEFYIGVIAQPFKLLLEISNLKDKSTLQINEHLFPCCGEPWPSVKSEDDIGSLTEKSLHYQQYTTSVTPWEKP